MKEQIHISIVLGSFRIGGAEKVMIRLANGFAERNIKCSLVVLDDSGPLKSNVSSSVQVVNLNAIRARRGVKPFRQFLKTMNPDVLIVSQTHIQIMALLAVKWEQWKGKVILNEHSLFSYNNKRPLNNLLAKYLFNRADAVTAVSKAVADNYIRNFQFLDSKVSVVHNAAYDPEILELKKASVDFDSSLPVIITAGRLTVSKNYKLLLDAFALVLKQKPSRLMFLGDGDARDELNKHAISLDISSNVVFAGNVENPYAFMSRSYVFVLTSTYEGLPTVLVEALACGCNIVCTNSPGGSKEVLLDGKFGALVSPDALSLSKAILKSMETKSEAAQKLIRAQEFSVEIAVFKYLSLINHLS